MAPRRERGKSRALEAAFVAEMLKKAGEAIDAQQVPFVGRYVWFDEAEQFKVDFTPLRELLKGK